MADALDQLQKDKGLDIRMHIDGASGGFLAPFCAPDLVWDFRLPRVKSINASGHKFGLSPLGVGWVIWREETDLPEEEVFWVNYLGGNMRDIALNFSQAGRPDHLPVLQLPADWAGTVTARSTPPATTPRNTSPVKLRIWVRSR